MTETPDEDQPVPDEDAAARDSLAGDIAKKLDPDVDALDDGQGSADPHTGD